MNHKTPRAVPTQDKSNAWMIPKSMHVDFPDAISTQRYQYLLGLDTVRCTFLSVILASIHVCADS